MEDIPGLPEYSATAGVSHAPVEKAAHHHHHRALFRRGTATHPAMVCFVNVKSVDRIIYSIFQRFNLE